MPNFNLDDLIGKATAFLDKASEDHLKKSDQYDALIELINDSNLRSAVESLIAQGTVVGASVLGRLQEIFAEDEEPEETVEPESTMPTPRDDPFQVIFAPDFEERLSRLFEQFGAQRGDDEKGDPFSRPF